MDITKKAIDWQSFSENFDLKISTFFKQYKIGTLTHDAHIYKTKGYSAISIFIRLFLLQFIGTNIYREIVIINRLNHRLRRCDPKRLCRSGVVISQ